MSLLTILHYPDPRLRNVAKSVTVFDAALRNFTADLVETMYEAPGIGLAASQVNVHRRIIVVDISENRDDPHVLINPELTPTGEEVETEEGCLSVPGIYEPVVRRESITVRAFNPHGDVLDFAADGMLAVCIQHECDHLEGRLFVDYLSRLKRSRIKRKLEKRLKQRG
jgi:peptide deformylase